MAGDKEQLKALVDLYHKSMTMHKTDFEKHYGSKYKQTDVECEVRFGGRGSRAFSKLDYDRVIHHFQQAGFTTDNPHGLHLLRINTEYFHNKQQRHVFSNIRAEIRGLDAVQQYSRTNKLPEVVKFTQKCAPEINGERIKPVDFADFSFRASYQMEKNWLPSESEAVQKTMNDWTNVKKVFRFLNRVRFRHATHPVFLDVSIIKSSATEMNRATKQNVPIPEYAIQEAKVFDNAETYEIELELDNAAATTTSSASLLASLRHCIRLVLSGLQGSPFPIGIKERNFVLQHYLTLVQPPQDDKKPLPDKVTSHHFIGPHPLTLQLENLSAIGDRYTVTDKADGDRKLLFVCPKTGQIYLLDTTMQVIFTGRKVRDERMWNSLLDGEHLKRDRLGRAINKFKVFDIYFWNGKSKRELAFYEPFDDGGKEYEERLRLPLLQKWVREVQFETKGDDGDRRVVKRTDFTVEAKTFLTTYEKNIFAACKEIWEAIEHPAYEYATDGLIFTPAHSGVGADHVGHSGPLHKHTWKTAFKWKPAQWNTIDFLVRIASPDDSVEQLDTTPGLNLTQYSPVEKFKTLTLCCGFNPRDHGYLNPRQMMLDDAITATTSDKDYLPCAFEPSDPADPDAHICECVAIDQGNGEYVLKTEEGEYFHKDMIVEFRYDKTALSPRRRWIPLRVRYDKTNELKMGYKNYGNAFHVAESNWRSIWYEITKEMITTGEGIPTIVQDDVYYNRIGETLDTRGLRQFHNHFVKRRLILKVSHPGDHLVDFGVGKAGDLRKWADAKIAFVWGIDLSLDNIENRKDGACARYVGMYRNSKMETLPKAIFMHGNVVENLKTGDAFSVNKDRAIAKALFGQGPRDKTELGLGVYPHYGVAERGFHVASCQFAIHYFFQNVNTLRAFLRNVSECTREEGHFICTCFDGNLVFDQLRHQSNLTLLGENGHKIFEIVKQYNQSEFADDESSLGYAIDVYQDSINTSNREFLVNAAYLQREMENHGFVLTEGGLFRELYAELLENPHLNPEMDRALHMTQHEKTISFLNRYFIFKKVRTVQLEPVPVRLASKTPEVAVSEPEPEPEPEAPKKKETKKNKFRPIAKPLRVII